MSVELNPRLALRIVAIAARRAEPKPRLSRKTPRVALHEMFLKLAEGQTVDAISWMGLL